MPAVFNDTLRIDINTSFEIWLMIDIKWYVNRDLTKLTLSCHIIFEESCFDPHQLQPMDEKKKWNNDVKKWKTIDC